MYTGVPTAGMRQLIEPVPRISICQLLFPQTVTQRLLYCLNSLLLTHVDDVAGFLLLHCWNDCLRQEEDVSQIDIHIEVPRFRRDL